MQSQLQNQSHFQHGSAVSHVVGKRQGVLEKRVMSVGVDRCSRHAVIAAVTVAVTAAMLTTHGDQTPKRLLPDYRRGLERHQTAVS